MVYYIIIAIVCFFASVIGAICGIGGGVIIKPVLDATGILPVTTISFLSGCTVLSMSVVSLYKNIIRKKCYQFNKDFAVVISSGSAVGGLVGKELYQSALSHLTDASNIGSIQAFVLTVITMGTLLYSLKKNTIKTKKIRNKVVIFLVGAILGIMSSFLGIGGGPINLVVLFYFFSMETKEAVLYSISIIMFSQVSNLLSTIVQDNVPGYSPYVLGLMIACGILGGIVGSYINEKVDNSTVDKLFLGLMNIIILINIYNIVRYL